MWCCSSTRSTPRCANPRAKPPPNASPNPWPGRRCRPLEGAEYVAIRHALRMPATPFPRLWVARPEKNSTYVLRSATPLKMRKLFASTSTSTLLSLYQLAPADQKGDSLGVGTNHTGGGMPSAFATWIGQPVVLQVALGDIRVPLRGKLLKEGGDTLRMRHRRRVGRRTSTKP